MPQQVSRNRSQQFAFKRFRTSGLKFQGFVTIGSAVKRQCYRRSVRPGQLKGTAHADQGCERLAKPPARHTASPRGMETRFRYAPLSRLLCAPQPASFALSPVANVQAQQSRFPRRRSPPACLLARASHSCRRARPAHLRASAGVSCRESRAHCLTRTCCHGKFPEMRSPAAGRGFFFSETLFRRTHAHTGHWLAGQPE